MAGLDLRLQMHGGARAPNALEKARARLLRQAAVAIAQGQKVCNEKQVGAVTTSESTGGAVRKLKMSSVLVKGGPPMEDFEPSPEQISALHNRVVEQKMEPYADFSLLTPFGRRGDGTYKPADIPGPPNFVAWGNCYKVYSAALLMLRFDDGTCVVKLQALEIYNERFRHLVEEHGEAWHLCCQAEDRCRFEMLPRLRRELKHDEGQPWDDVFVKASEADRYWDREVRRPALAFVARGRSSALAALLAEKRSDGQASLSHTSGAAKRRARPP
eukprot:2927404-Amphidinium_carterae.1